jgi:hypothetical protein
MTQITATVNSQPITATVNASGSISASVGSSLVTASAGGGIGPQGEPGVAGAIGPPGNALSAASDVQLSGVAEGDVLRYSNSKWRNYPEGDIVIDGQNF